MSSPWRAPFGHLAPSPYFGSANGVEGDRDS